jgi:dynein heavy chain 1
MTAMQTNCMSWMEKIPSELQELQITAVSIKDPLCRFFNREVSVAIDLLKQVRDDIEQLLEVCEGRGKLTNSINALKDDLIQGQVPKAWKKYTFPAGVTTIVWIADFVERCKQYTGIVEHAKTGKNLRTAKVWLGGLQEPAAFFTASRQSVAQATGISLEQLRMEIAVGSELDDKSLILVNLRFEGGRSKDGALHMMDDMSVTEEATVLKWISGEPAYPASEKVRMPIYMNCSRKQLIDQIDFKAAPGTSEGTFYERGAALICSALGGV